VHKVVLTFAAIVAAISLALIGFITPAQAAVPGATTITSFTPANTELSVTFTVADSSASDMEYSLDGGSNWVLRAGTTSPLVITGLTNGTSYLVKLRAKNGDGIGTESATVTMIAGIPAAPVLVSVEPDAALAGRLHIVFNLLTSPAPVTLYQYELNGDNTWNSAGMTGSLTLINLTAGTPYSFRIRAVNNYTPGDASNAISGTPNGVPSAPSGVSVDSVTTTSATLSFTPGSANGGGGISNYEYKVDSGAWTAMSPSVTTGTSLIIANLSAGTTYSVQLRALNTFGSGTASSAVAVTTTAPAPIPDPSPTPASSDSTTSATPAATSVPVVAPEAAPSIAEIIREEVNRILAASPAQVQALSAAAIGELAPAALAAMSPAQVKALNPAQVSELSSTQIQALSPQSVGAMKPITLTALSMDQIRALPPDSVRALKPAALSAFSAAQIWALPPESVRAITPLALQAFSVAQFRALTPESVRAIRPAVLRSLSIDQIRGFSKEQAAALTNRQISKLSTEARKIVRAVREG